MTTLKVYYDEIDGELIPKWVMMPRIKEKGAVQLFSVESPYARFYQEDFHDELRLISVSQGALKQCPYHDHQFHIDIEQLQNDLLRQDHDPEAVFETDYFVALVDDLQELLAYDVVTRFS